MDLLLLSQDGQQRDDLLRDIARAAHDLVAVG
jgi:hypothetical protein